MYIHFDLPCDSGNLLRSHFIFRQKITEWKRSKIVLRAVMTVRTDLLYICLDIPTIERREISNCELSDETKKQIPMQIINAIGEAYDLKHIRFKDYELEVRRGRETQGNSYYEGAAIEEILRFASEGTRIAFDMLEAVDRSEEPWTSDKDLAVNILSRVRDLFGPGYTWTRYAFHFVCYALGLPTAFNDCYLWEIAQPGRDDARFVLDQLYRQYA